MGSSSRSWRFLFLTLTLAQRAVGHGEVKMHNRNSRLDTVPVKSALTAEDAIVMINQRIFQYEKPWRSFLIEGDIVTPLWRNAVLSETKTWQKSPDGMVRIPYEISSQYDEETWGSISRGFKDFEKFTCVRFVPHVDEEDFISIQPIHGCYSSVGRVGGMQLISLNHQCLKKGKGVVEHEIMHSLGFWHEHARSDRDKYIKIEWKNVWPGYEHNFLKQNTNNLKSKYDYGSILHYSRSAFSKNGLPTLRPLIVTDAVIGQRIRLSEMDLLKVNRLYNCSSHLKDKANVVKHLPLVNDDGSGRSMKPGRLKAFWETYPGPARAGVHTAADLVTTSTGNGSTVGQTVTTSQRHRECFLVRACSPDSWVTKSVPAAYNDSVVPSSGEHPLEASRYQVDLSAVALVREGQTQDLSLTPTQQPPIQSSFAQSLTANPMTTHSLRHTTSPALATGSLTQRPTACPRAFVARFTEEPFLHPKSPKPVGQIELLPASPLALKLASQTRAPVLFPAEPLSTDQRTPRPISWTELPESHTRTTKHVHQSLASGGLLPTLTNAVNPNRLSLPPQSPANHQQRSPDVPPVTQTEITMPTKMVTPASQARVPTKTPQSPIPGTGATLAPEPLSTQAGESTSVWIRMATQTEPPTVVSRTPGPASLLKTCSRDSRNKAFKSRDTLVVTTIPLPARTPLGTTAPALTPLVSNSTAQTLLGTTPAETLLVSNASTETPVVYNTTAETLLTPTPPAGTPPGTTPEQIQPPSTAPARTPLGITPPAGTVLVSNSTAPTLLGTTPAEALLASNAPTEAPVVYNTTAGTPPPSTAPGRTPPPSTAPGRTPPPSTAPAGTPPPSTAPRRTPPPSTAPGRTPPPSTAPGRTPPPSTAPGRTPPPSTAPGRTPPPSTAPGRTPPPSTAPGRTPPPSTAPGRTPPPSTAPGRTPPRSTAPGWTPPRSTAPGRTPSRSTAPGRTPPRSTAPGRTPPRSTAPGRTPPRSTAPGRTPPRSTAPGRTPPRSTAPGRTPPPSTAPAGTPPPSTAPGRTPPPSTAPGRTPPPSTAPARTPPPSTAPARTPPPSTAPAGTPPSSTAPGRTPTPSTAPAGTPPPSTAPGRTPPPSTAPGRTPPPSTVPGRTPPPSTVPGRTPPPSTAPGRTPPPSTAPGRTPPPSTAPGRTPPPSTAPGRTPPPSTAPGRTPPPSTAPGRTPPPSTAPAGTLPPSTLRLTVPPPAEILQPPHTLPMPVTSAVATRSIISPATLAKLQRPVVSNRLYDVDLISPSQSAVIDEPSVELRCDFEHGLCDWEQSITDDFDWLLHRFQTFSRETGPKGDHTKGQCKDRGGRYLYLEASYPRQSGEQAALRSPLLRGRKCLSFWYNMYGKHMGSLNVHLKREGSPHWHRLWSVTGNQGRRWINAEIDLFTNWETYRVIIEGVRGLNYQGDAAIDDVQIYSSSCSAGRKRRNPSCDWGLKKRNRSHLGSRVV
uniref:proline-rich protein 36-like n=1 Tax=Pristiophorus japonicus TaxID=55135 RepID=UPI00398E89C9